MIPPSMCSTPFGITDLITRRGVRHCWADLVLNAFRHHRSHHLGELPLDELQGQLCSTPFGITDLITKGYKFMKKGV